MALNTFISEKFIKEENINYFLPKGYPCKIVNYDAVTNQNINIKRNCDICKLYALLISANYTENDFKNLIITIDGTEIWKIPFKLIYYLSDKIINDNNKIILFSEFLFSIQCLTTKKSIKGIAFDYLNFHEINILLTSHKQINYTFITKCIYFDDGQKFQKTQLPHVVYQYKKQKISNDMELKINYLPQGFFLETYEEIKYVKIESDNKMLLLMDVLYWGSTSIRFSLYFFIFCVSE